MEEAISDIAQYLLQAKNVVALTGPGSAPNLVYPISEVLEAFGHEWILASFL